MADDVTPPWDQEAAVDQARRQVVSRVGEQASGRGVEPYWLRGTDVDGELAAIERLGGGVVVGSEMTLWRWPSGALTRLSAQLRIQDGVLIFLEPTAGLGLRRAAQLLRRRYRRDIPADLRSAGFIVTTQIRMHHGVVADYVRGEARHFPAASESER